jgi:hypothetical protein
LSELSRKSRSNDLVRRRILPAELPLVKKGMRPGKPRARNLKRPSKNRGKRKKKEISLDRLFQYIMGRKMSKSERIYFGLKIARRKPEEKK